MTNGKLEDFVNPRYRLLLIDFDGTIVNTREAIAQSILAAFCQAKLDVPPARDITTAISAGLALEETFKTLYNQATSRQVTELVGLYLEAYTEAGPRLTETFPGVFDVISEFSACGVKAVIVSNKGSDDVWKLLDHVGMTKLFDLVVAQDEGCGLGKPDSLLFSERIYPHFSQVPLDSILCVGDTELDLDFADKIGIDSCWARYGFGDVAKCNRHYPTFTISSLYQLSEIVSQKP